MIDLVCLTDEFFTRYIGALFECGLPTELAAVGFAETHGWFSFQGLVGCVVSFSLYFICPCAWPHLRSGRREMKNEDWRGLGSQALGCFSW